MIIVGETLLILLFSINLILFSIFSPSRYTMIIIKTLDFHSDHYYRMDERLLINFRAGISFFTSIRSFFMYGIKAGGIVTLPLAV